MAVVPDGACLSHAPCRCGVGCLRRRGLSDLGDAVVHTGACPGECAPASWPRRSPCAHAGHVLGARPAPPHGAAAALLLRALRLAEEVQGALSRALAPSPGPAQAAPPAPAAAPGTSAPPHTMGAPAAGAAGPRPAAAAATAAARLHPSMYPSLDPSHSMLRLDELLALARAVDDVGGGGRGDCARALLRLLVLAAPGPLVRAPLPRRHAHAGCIGALGSV